jgi:uncharacterized protein (DUF697 family)/archaellum component FlaC
MATEVEKQSLKRLQDRFVTWRRDKADPYLRAVENAQNKFFEVDAQGKLSQALREQTNDFMQAHRDFENRLGKLGKKISDAVSEPPKDVQALIDELSDEFGDLKGDQTQLKNDFAPIKSAIYKSEALRAEEAKVEAKEEARLTKPEDADAIVNKYALIATAVGLVPIPFLDIVGIAGFQAKMLDELYKLYFPDEPAGTAGFSKNFTQNLLTIVLSGLGTGLVGGAIGSALKFVPVLGWLPGAGAVSLIGGTATFVVGKLVKEELDKGLSPTQIMDTLKTVEKSKVTELRKAAARVLRT